MPAYPCTVCGGDAFIGYAAGRRKEQDWGGKVKRGERLCTRCFQRRGGENMLARPARPGLNRPKAND